MDFVLLSALRIFRQHGDRSSLPINIVYDIACQYNTNLLSRVDSKHPPDLQLPNYLRNIKPFVPKFHLPAHGAACQTKYSLNLHKGCGRTYGERTEQEWAHTKKCAAATLEMGPGARHITLDDQWGGWNWERLIGLGEFHVCLSAVAQSHATTGELLDHALRDAIKWARKMRTAAEETAAMWPADIVKKWRKDVEMWQADPKQNEDPFAEPEYRKSHLLVLIYDN